MHVRVCIVAAALLPPPADFELKTSFNAANGFTSIECFRKEHGFLLPLLLRCFMLVGKSVCVPHFNQPCLIVSVELLLVSDVLDLDVCTTFAMKSSIFALCASSFLFGMSRGGRAISSTVTRVPSGIVPTATSMHDNVAMTSSIRPGLSLASTKPLSTRCFRNHSCGC